MSPELVDRIIVWLKIYLSREKKQKESAAVGIKTLGKGRVN